MSPITPRTKRMTPKMMTKRFIVRTYHNAAICIGDAGRRTARPVGDLLCLTYKVLRAAGRGGGFLGGLGCGGGLAATLGLRWSRGRFAGQFGRHDAGYEQLGAMIVKIHGGTFLVGSGHDTQAVHFMLDGLTFLHHLHNILLDALADNLDSKSLGEEAPNLSGGSAIRG